MHRPISLSVFMAVLSLILILSTTSCGAGEIPPTPTPTVTSTPIPTNTPLPTFTPVPPPAVTPSAIGLEGSLSATIQAFQNLGCTLMDQTDAESTNLDCSDELGVHMVLITTSSDLPPDTMQFAALNLVLSESNINNGQLLFNDRHNALISQYLLSMVPVSRESINSWLEEQMDPESDLSMFGAASTEVDGLYVDASVTSPILTITIWGRE